EALIHLPCLSRALSFSRSGRFVPTCFTSGSRDLSSPLRRRRASTRRAANQATFASAGFLGCVFSRMIVKGRTNGSKGPHVQIHSRPREDTIRRASGGKG